MDKNEIIELIKKYSPNAKVTDESKLFDDLGLSSLKVFSLLCEVEKILGKQLNIMSFVGIKTVKELIDKIELIG